MDAAEHFHYVMPIPMAIRSTPGAPFTRLGGALPFIPVALTATVHYMLTRGCFRADDFLNLYQINNYSLAQYLVIPNAGHLLLARNVVFYVSWLLFGTHAWPYLWTAFLTHLVNVWLLFLVIDRFTHSRSAATFGAAAWGVLPLHADAVGYYAVYGHVMVGTAMLIVLLQASRAADDGTGPSRALAAFWYALALIAATCFGTGIAFAMMLPFVLALLLPHWRRAWRLRLPLWSLLIVVPALYVALHWLYQVAFDQPRIVGARIGAVAPGRPRRADRIRPPVRLRPLPAPARPAAAGGGVSRRLCPPRRRGCRTRTGRRARAGGNAATHRRLPAARPEQLLPRARDPCVSLLRLSLPRP